MNSESKSFISIFISGCLWGTIGLYVKLMESAGSSAQYTSFIRLLFGLFLLTLMTIIFEGPKALLIGKKTLISCILLGTVSSGLYNILYSMSINTNGMAVASVLLYTAPVFTAVSSLILFRENISGAKWLALLVNILGCSLTATGGDLGSTHIVLSGVLIGIGAGFGYGMSAVFGRIAMEEKSSPYAVAAYNMLFGTLFVVLTSHPWATVTDPFNKKILLYGFLYALIPTALAYVFYFKALSKIKQISKVPVIASVELIVATLIGTFVFGETIRAGNITGVVLVLLSILLFSRQDKTPL